MQEYLTQLTRPVRHPARTGHNPKETRPMQKTIIALAAVALLAATPAFAANLYWDANGAVAGTGGTGEWNLADLTWRDGGIGGALQAWDNGTNGNAAYLGGTVGTLTLGANVTASFLSSSSGYQINGDGGGLYKLTLDSTSKVGGDGGVYAVMMNDGGGLLTVNAPTELTGAFYHQFRGSITFNGVVSGSAGLGSYSFRTLILNNANTFTGGYGTVNGGTLIIGHDQGMGTGSILTTGVSIQAGNGNRTIANPITPTGGNGFGMTTGGANNLTLSGGAGTGTVGGNGLTFNVGNPVLTIDRPLYAYWGAPSNTFTKSGTGTLVLNESSVAHIGATAINVNAGTLIVNGGTTEQSILNGTTTAGSPVITGLSSTAGLRVGQAVNGTGNPGSYPVIVSIDSASQVTLAQAWNATGTPSLTFFAVGGLGHNSGNVTVANAAKLGGSGTMVLGAGGTVTVQSGGTLMGTLTINGPVAIQTGGALKPGSSIGTLNTGALTLAGAYEVELGTPGLTPAAGLSDRTVVTGDVTLTGGTLQLVDNANANGQGSAGAGRYRLIDYTGNRTDTFASVVNPTAKLAKLAYNDAETAVDLELWDHGVASFSDASTTTSLTVDLGQKKRNSGTYSLGFAIYNLLQTAGLTAGLDMSFLLVGSDEAALWTDLASLTNLAGGDSGAFLAFLDSALPLGSYSETYQLTLTDNTAGFYGAANPSQILTLTLTATIIPEPASAALLALAGLAALRRRR